MVSTGNNLIIGKQYTTKGEPYLDKWGILCYFIEELQAPKLCCRFTKVLEKEKPFISFEIKQEELQLN